MPVALHKRHHLQAVRYKPAARHRAAVHKREAPLPVRRMQVLVHILAARPAASMVHHRKEPLHIQAVPHMSPPPAPRSTKAVRRMSG